MAPEERPETTINSRMDIAGICAEIASCAKRIETIDHHPRERRERGYERWEKRKKLRWLTSQFERSAAYNAMQKEIGRELRADLLNSFDIRALNRDWQLMREEEKGQIGSEILTRMSHIQSRLTGIEIKPLTLTFMESDGSTLGRHSGRYTDDPSTYRLIVNMSRHKGTAKEFPLFLEVLTHENVHSMQTQLARALHLGQINEHHSLYRDAVILKTIQDKNAYVPPEVDHDIYETQIEEADAFEFGHEMADFAHGWGEAPRLPSWREIYATPGLSMFTQPAFASPA